jgi:hypothetical protein
MKMIPIIKELHRSLVREEGEEEPYFDPLEAQYLSRSS